MKVVIIYDSPIDLGAGYAVRFWTLLPDGTSVPTSLAGLRIPSLSDARELVPGGMVNIGRFPDDDARIVEVWV